MSRLRGAHESLLPLNIGFILIGIGTTILGPILPSLSVRLGMDDAHAGSLFTAQFLGSSIGALVAAFHPIRSAIAGYVTAGLGLCLLNLASPRTALPSTFFYGLGVGLVLTGINLSASGVRAEKRSVVLSWLNFCWSAGATICPVLAAFFIGRHSLPVFLFSLALCYACMAAVLASRAGIYMPAASAPEMMQENRHASLNFLVGYFALLLFLYVGVETTLGGWLSTLATRLTGSNSASTLAISTSSFFWLALLVGRGVTPILLKRVRETVLQPAAVALCVLSIILLLSVRSLAGVTVAAGLAGLALAPIFPLSLSFFLSHAGQSRRAGIVFAICGVGGAVLPWMTGIFSTYRHSLHWGLSVPLFGAILMLWLSLHYVLSIHWTLVSPDS